MTSMQELFESLRRRRRPEDIAELIQQELSGQLNRGEEAILRRAARGALVRRPWGYTSMTDDFARPTGLGRQVNVVRAAFPAGVCPRTVGLR